MLALACCCLCGQDAGAQVKETERLERCRQVLREVLGIPEGLSRNYLDRAECVVVIPGVKKAALGVGGRFGRGAALCRAHPGAGWSPPSMITVGGASIGLQIGGESADVVLLVMNRGGIEHLLQSQFTLGADASVAAGPKGRQIEGSTDGHFEAEILGYSRTKGLFAGVSLEGAVVKQDRKGNLQVYGEELEAREVLLKPGRRVPAAARALVDELREVSPRQVKGG